jgi:hypothetical protein
MPTYNVIPYQYACAGCGNNRHEYIGEIYVYAYQNKWPDLTHKYGIIHKYCCSEKCYYFAWLKHIQDIVPGFKNNPQLFTKP